MSEIELMQQEIDRLRTQVKALKSRNQLSQNYYYSDAAQKNWLDVTHIPEYGITPEAAQIIIESVNGLDFDYRFNTSSYVNVFLEKEERDIALLGLHVNMADQTVYPNSYKLHDTVVNMIANLWHCPKPDDFDDYGVYAGAGTVGSTEACLLAGLALKFRWRNWYAKHKNLTGNDVLGTRPNLVISTCFQAAWEKLFKYMDIEPRLIQPSVDTFTLDPEKVREAIDEHTMGVVCIMGNHYSGHYDPVEQVNEVVEEVNAARGYQVGIHVDAASGGFIAPFQSNLRPWDFRLNNVLSISTSGHKYGESCCGTGWVVWRQRKDLSEHVAISVTYLGGNADSYTLNFSRPASGVYVQYYQLIRQGLSGYQQCCDNLMQNAKFLREGLKAMTYRGKPRFTILDNGDTECLPVVTARLNPDCDISYDDIDLQHVLSQYRWYVSGYRMQYEHPLSGETLPLFYDQAGQTSMFRIVVKSNLTRNVAKKLLESFMSAFEFIDPLDFTMLHGFKTENLRHQDQRITNHC